MDARATKSRHLRGLASGDRPRIGRLLIGLDASDRHRRFGSVVGDDWLDVYCGRIDMERHLAIGGFEGERLAGVAELIRTSAHPAGWVEIAVAVERPARDRGLGTELVRAALRDAARMGQTHAFLVFERSNRAMSAIAGTFGAERPNPNGEYVLEL